MHLDLQPGPVGRLAEVNDLFVGIVEDAVTALGVHIGRVHGRVMGAEATVQRALKAAADPRQLPDVHGLGIDAKLHPVGQPRGKDLLHGDVEIGHKAHAADGVHHTDTLGGHEVHRPLHIREQLGNGERAGDIIGDGKKGLLIHLPGVGVEAAQRPQLFLQLLQQLGIDDAGVSVVLDDHDLLIRADAVKLLPADKAALPNRIG